MVITATYDLTFSNGKSKRVSKDIIDNERRVVCAESKAKSENQVTEDVYPFENLMEIICVSIEDDTENYAPHIS